MTVYLIYLKYTKEDEREGSFYILSSRDSMCYLNKEHFITKGPDFNLLLYAYTNDKKLKNGFMGLRDPKVFYVKKVEMTDYDYKRLKTEYKDGMLTSRDLISGLNREFPVVMTNYEFMITISEDIDQLYLVYTGEYSLLDILPPLTLLDIFKDEERETLEELGVGRFTCVYPEESSEERMEVNELNLFLDNFVNTIRKDFS